MENNALSNLAAKQAERALLDEEMKVLKNEAKALLVEDSESLISKICEVLEMSDSEAVSFIVGSLGIEIGKKESVRPAKKRVRLSSVQVTGIIEKLKEGATPHDLSLEYGVSYSKVNALKKDAGLSKPRVSSSEIEADKEKVSEVSEVSEVSSLKIEKSEGLWEE